MRFYKNHNNQQLNEGIPYVNLIDLQAFQGL